MNAAKFLTTILLAQLLILPSVFAGDFDWLKQLNISAEADSSGFNATLATRFKVGDAEIKAVFSKVDHLSDAYMVFRLGEMSHQSTDYVIKQYHANKNRGWGVLAKSLGIKPGSSEFHALKAGHDLPQSGGSHAAMDHKRPKDKGQKSKGKNK